MLNRTISGSHAHDRWAKSVHVILFTKRLETAIAEKQRLLNSPRSAPSLSKQIKSVVRSTPLNVLLLSVPFSFASYYMNCAPAVVFGLAFLSLIPLAALLGNFTEELASHSSETVGALLNATFGNATELIVSLFALKAGMYNIIKNSLIGSVFGNMMLVLGCAFLAGGLTGETKFNKRVTSVYSSLLLLACLGLIIPTAFRMMHSVDDQMTLHVSREVAVCMCVGYVLYLLFQLWTHRKMFEDDLEEEEEDINLSVTSATVGLALSTILVAFESEFLVSALEPAAVHWGLGTTFVSIILVPIVGNAAEHATAIVMAYRGKMDIAIGVAVGSSIQIALFVVPLLVVISAILGKDLDLNFGPFSCAITLTSVITVNWLVSDGNSNWLSGAKLLLAYLMVAFAYLNVPEPTASPMKFSHTGQP